MAISDYVDFTNNYLVKNGMIGNATNINKPTDKLKLEVDELNSTKVAKVTSTDNAIVRFDGTTGAIQNSTVTVSDTGVITGTLSGNASTATALQTSRNIGGVAFNGTADINLPGVNTAGNQNTTGSAATLTTGRTIGMTGDVTWTSAAFNGSGNVTGTSTLATITDSGTGSFVKITKNTKGLVTGTTPVVQSDITSLLGSGSITNSMLPNSGVTAGTYPKVTVDAKGIVTAGSAMTMEDIPSASFKKSVTVATTANITLSGTQTIDGVALVAGDRVLVKDQTTTSQNGIYVVNASAWTRSLDADTSEEIASAIVNVDKGSVNGGQTYTNTFKSTDTIGTTAMSWYKMVFENGTWAISVTGNAATSTTLASTRTFSATGDVTAVAQNFNGSQNVALPMVLANSGVTAGTYTKVTVDAKGRATSGTTLSDTDIPNLDTGKLTTGTLSVSRGGTGVTTSTGSGSVVLSTSPVLTTPNIGVATGTSFNSITGLSSTTPSNNGTAAVGTSTTAARADHVHASDATKVTANTAITAGTATKITYDSKGLVTAGAQMTLEDIPDSTFKKSVRCATTANITLSGLQTIDGITVVAGDRVLVKDQTTASQNGIYLANSSTWTRSLDADATSELASVLVAVDSGTVNGGRLFDNDLKTTDTIGTTAVNFNLVVDTGFASTVVGSTPGTAAIGTSTSYARADHVHPVQTTVSGNAGTATKLQTARTINGVSFDGSGNIEIEDRLGTAIASAATITIGTRGLGDYIHITGTTTITSLGTAVAAGIRRTLIFDGALTLTHNATSLICPGATNIVTIAGTVIEVVSETTANWRVVSITHPSLSMAEISYLDGVTSAIQTQLNAKAALASPALTGTPTAPTAAVGTNTTQVATTAFVNAEIANDAVPRVTSTDNAIARFNGTTGSVQNSAITIDDSGNLGSGTQSFNGFGGSGFKNYIINGNFDIWQRGLGPFTNFNYGADRWVSCNATAEMYSSLTSTNGVQKRIAHFKNVPAGTFFLAQAIELPFVGFGHPFSIGKKFTVSVRYSGAFKIRPKLIFRDGVVGANPVDLDSTMITPIFKGGSVVDETVSWTFTVNNPAAITNNCLVLSLESETTASNIYIYQVQLEEGSVATPFEQRPYGLELSLCQRYYQVISQIEGITHSNTYWYGDATFVFPTEMRTVPTLIGGAFSNNTGPNGTFAASGITSKRLFFYNGANNWVSNSGCILAGLTLSAEI